MLGKRRFAVLLRVAVLAAAAALVASCSPSRQEGTAPPRPLQVTGAEVALPFIKELCNAYSAANPHIRFEYLPPSSSVGGLQGVANGELDVAAVSRPLTPEEKKLGLKEVWLALDPLLLVVHSGTGVYSLTTQQVRDIYAGRVTNWKSVGGADQQIVVIDRPEQASGKIIFRETILGADLVVTPRAAMVAKSDEVHDAILSTDGSIGYTSFSLYGREHPGLAVVRLDGAYPDERSVRDHAYVALRPFGFAIAKKADSRVKLLVGFALSPAGTAIVRRMGLFPGE